MGSQQVEVEVFSSGRRVEGPLLRPVRLLPTGRAGVVYAGEVYPLHPGDRIDLSDDSWHKYDCPEFVADGQTIPYAIPSAIPTIPPARDHPLLREGAWNLESNRFGHYVVFDADEKTAQNVVDRLEHSVLGVRRWGASHRAADDGRFYEWFVRLTFEGEREECLRNARAVLGLSQAPVPPGMHLEGVPGHLRDSVLSALQKALVLARDNSSLQQEVAGLQLELSRARAETEQTRTEMSDQVSLVRGALQVKTGQLEHLRREEETLRHALHDRIKQLQKSHQHQLAVLNQQLAAATAAQGTGESTDAEALRGQVASSQQEVDALMTALEESWDASQELNDRLVAAGAQVDALTAEGAAAAAALKQKEARLAEVDNELKERATAHRVTTTARRRPDLQTFLGKLFQRFDLDEESIEELFKFDRTDKVIHQLMRIDGKDPQLRAVTKKVQGYDGWWELSKINTGAKGKSAMGRIYYRHHASGVLAVVHLKRNDEEQRHFMARRLGTDHKS